MVLSICLIKIIPCSGFSILLFHVHFRGIFKQARSEAKALEKFSKHFALMNENRMDH